MKKISFFLSLVLIYVIVLPLSAFCATQHEHDFSQKKTTFEYFAEDSTETSATKFYYSCKNCGEKSTETFEYGKKDSERAAVGSKAKETLDGKKILIVGCSYNFYGKIVMRVAEKTTALSARQNDKGYLYELCKQNGADVEVTNWCFGNHDLTDLLGTYCAAERDCGTGFNHLEALKEGDLYYDYVSLMDVSRPNKVSMKKYIEELKGFMKLFTDVNPNCKFIYSLPCGAYWYKNADRTNFKESYVGTVYAKEIAKLDNVIVMDWGKMVYDLIKKNAEVPGATKTYYASSFIVYDGYHPNLLSGYINTLMTYCLITGETAVGQPTNLENGLEPAGYPQYKKSNYTQNFYYNHGKTSNFANIMDSSVDMEGIQKLVNRYIDMDTYLDYCDSIKYYNSITGATLSQNGSTVNTIPKNGNFDIKVGFESMQEGIAGSNIIVALYDDEKRLINLKNIEITDEILSADYASTHFDETEYEISDIKIFVWNGLSDFIPLASYYEL